MSLAFGEGVETRGPWSAIGRLNAVTKLAVTAVVTIGLLLSLDTITAGVILICELLALPFVGLRARTIAARGAILVVLAAMLTLVNALFSRNLAGVVLLDWGPFTLSSGGLATTAVIGIRVLALSLPAVLLLAATDPLELADGLQQHLRVPARYALSMFVGLRILPLLIQQWQELSAARRARGLSARGPVSAVRAALSRTVGLLVEALRRAVRMATAMQARGFDAYGSRTFARQSIIGAADWVAIGTALLVVVGAGAVAIHEGQWQFALGWSF